MGEVVERPELPCADGGPNSPRSPVAPLSGGNAVAPHEVLRAYRALANYPLDPGHSDLDNEQPMSVKVGDRFLRCTLGDIRRARMDRIINENALIEVGYVACERGDNLQMAVRRFRGLT